MESLINVDPLEFEREPKRAFHSPVFQALLYSAVATQPPSALFQSQLPFHCAACETCWPLATSHEGQRTHPDCKSFKSLLSF